MRAIAGFTGLLRDRHYETIDADARRCIDRVLAGTQRMSNLIDDLLAPGWVKRVAILGEAWKFTAGRAVAEIRFGAVQAEAQNENQRTFFVQDNGVGFVPRYAANLVRVCQRLLATGEIAGTGVGRSWADACVARGTTRSFTIAEGPQ